MIHPTARDRGRAVTFRHYTAKPGGPVVGETITGTIRAVDPMLVTVDPMLIAFAARAFGDMPVFLNRVDLEWVDG